MKILNLRFKNINSLYGEWSIDFTDQAYATNGIFAIVGPTGAGKSTILDAIALALYGTTLWLGRITQSGNELMSRQTAESFAEVTFAAQDGTYRCHCQHRARKKAAGNLADARHEIADAITGNLLESKKRDVAAVIEAKTGMDFDRFTRLVLLAQGGFAAFLKAAPDERSPVLEQITGTEVYCALSIKTYERYRAERETLDRLQAGVEGVALLRDDALQQLQTDIGEKQRRAEQFVEQQDNLRRVVQWIHARDLLQAETGELETALTIETPLPKQSGLLRPLQ